MKASVDICYDRLGGRNGLTALTCTTQRNAGQGIVRSTVAMGVQAEPVHTRTCSVFLNLNDLPGSQTSAVLHCHCTVPPYAKSPA